MTNQVIPEAADPVVAYLNAHFRPEVAADLLAAAQPLMAIAWDEGHDAGFYARERWVPLGVSRDASESDATNPYRRTP